jgi:hypothetical protein
MRLVVAVVLAGSLVAGDASAAEPAAGAPAPAPAAVPVTVTVANPAAVARPGETIAVDLAELRKAAPGIDLGKTVVVDARGGAVLSQPVDLDGDEAPDQIVFQTDLAPKETKTFRLQAGARAPAARADYKVYGRFVRERHDDFAWENDLIAHRVYGPDLETWRKEPLTSSGVDVWVKRVPRLVANDWYMTGDYHRDLGEGADFYSVGKTRGCGGLGIWSGGKLAVSKNFTASRVLAAGPIRLVFELDYAPWEVAPGGAHVAETRRVTLDAGSRWNRFESTLKADGRAPLAVAVGISKHPGGAVELDARSASLRDWEPLEAGKSGNLGCAVVLSPGSHVEQQQTDGDQLLVTHAPARGPLVYYVGTAWDRAGHIADAAAWAADVRALAARLAAPVKVTVAAERVAKK